MRADENRLNPPFVAYSQPLIGLLMTWWSMRSFRRESGLGDASATTTATPVTKTVR